MVDKYLSNSNIKKSCEIFSKIKEPLKDEYLFKFNLYCLINNGKNEEAQLILDLNKELGFKDDYFENKINYLRSIGIHHKNIIIDPGIGFGKNLKHNMNLIRNISIFHSLGFPVLVGNSRKRFIKELSGKNDSKLRNGGTIASSIYLMMQGVQILRIHDVNETIQGLKIFKNIINN